MTASCHEVPNWESNSAGDRVARRFPGNGAEVLLVGADEATRRSLAEVLRRRGFEVCELPPGRETWLRHNASCFSAVLMEGTNHEDRGSRGVESLLHGREVTRLILPGGTGNRGAKAGGKGETILMGRPEVVDGLMLVLREWSSGEDLQRVSVPSRFPEFR
jgi:ActR/RegA family two-component response regulator